MDMNPSGLHYTWNNKRTGMGHITTILDIFPILDAFLALNLNVHSFIIP